MFGKNCTSGFYIKGGDVGFAGRQKSIFDQLAALDKGQRDLNQPNSNDVADSMANPSSRIAHTAKASSRRHRAEMRQFRGQESIFKRPDEPPRFQARTRAIPDYHKNPHKWVKYSLGDVSPEDMSNSTNTAAAFSFLQEIAARRDSGTAGDEDDTGPRKKLAFKRPRPKTTFATEHSVQSESSFDANKPAFKSSKLIMPEYVVGQSSSKKKERKKTSTKIADKTKEITLQHLMAEEGEDEIE